MVDAADLKSATLKRCVGSIPSPGTTLANTPQRPAKSPNPIIPPQHLIPQTTYSLPLRGRVRVGVNPRNNQPSPARTTPHHPPYPKSRSKLPNPAIPRAHPSRRNASQIVA